MTDSNGKSPVPEGGLREEFEYNRFERCWLRDLLLSEPSFEIALGRVQAEAFAASDRETFEKALIDAFIVMDREVFSPPLLSHRPQPGHIPFVSAADFACLQEEDDLQPCLVQGYPAASVERPADAQGRPLLASKPLMTLSIAPSRRKGPSDPGTFAVEWPPHDKSLDEILPNPHGISGGGVWLFSKLQDHDVWSPERSSLVGLASRWRIQEKEEVVVRIEFWLELVATQIPELGDEIMTILERIRPKSA